MTDKTRIIKDLQRKQIDYYEKNYLLETKHNYLRRLRRDQIAENINIESTYDFILDMGCGPAILFPELLNISKKYVAVDLTDTNLDAIRRDNGAKNIECIIDDLDHFDWEDNYFDLIICAGVIEYTLFPDDNILKLIRFLRERGMLICSLPNIESPYRLWSEYVYRYIARIKNTFSEHGYFYKRKLFSAASILKLLVDRVRGPIIFKYFGYKFIPQPFDHLFVNFDYKIVKHFQENPRRWLEKYGTEFLLIVTK